jgi:outer membrane protein assembly factor BamD
MVRRGLIIFVLAAFASSAAVAWIWPLPHKKKNNNPLANLNSQQPDKVLFDRGMDAMNHSRYDVARLTFQTLINTYPDSEYVARAKLGIGDAWYREGGTTALAQAEIEYKDFITFFPNMPEAAEAQLKVANIHYRQMEKPDRDFTHAKRAEEEYRQLILQFPDSKLVPVAQQRLREVQEVLGQREYEIGRFYYLREAYPAAIARLKTLADTYPLFSKADDTLFMLGSSYERQSENIRRSKLNAAAKARLIKSFDDQAAAAYARIITEYPITDRVDDAKHRLQALGRKVPRPTPEAVAMDKKIEASRREPGRISRIMGNFRHAPNVSESAKVGDPTLNDPAETSAVQLVREANAEAMGQPTVGGGSTVTIQTLKPGESLENQPVPSSTNPPAQTPAANPQAPADNSTTNQPAATSSPASNADSNGIEELKPLNGATPDTVPQQQPPQASANSPAQPPTPENRNAAVAESAQQTQQVNVPPPAQVNDVNAGSTSDQASTQDSQNTDQTSSKNESSSKKKKKEGLHKLIPF